MIGKLFELNNSFSDDKYIHCDFKLTFEMQITSKPVPNVYKFYFESNFEITLGANNCLNLVLRNHNND